MQALENIYTFKTKNFRISVDACEEFHDIDWCDDEEKALIIDKIDAGELVYFCAKASVWFKGYEIASDYLGGCLYESYESFKAKGGYFRDMVSQACKEARIHLNDMQNVKVR